MTSYVNFNACYRRSWCQSLNVHQIEQKCVAYLSKVFAKLILRMAVLFGEKSPLLLDGFTYSRTAEDESEWLWWLFFSCHHEADSFGSDWNVETAGLLYSLIKWWKSSWDQNLSNTLVSKQIPAKLMTFQSASDGTVNIIHAELGKLTSSLCAR